MYQEGGFRALSALTMLPIVIAMLVLAGAKWLAGVNGSEEAQALRWGDRPRGWRRFRRVSPQ
jgi:hypothetical protein